MRSLSLYFRLALNNLKANSKMYIPYFVASVMMITLEFILCNLAMNPNNGSKLGAMLGIGIIFLSIFIFVFTFYINSFLIKKRVKEFGLYNILGMEKKQIGFILIIETIILFLCAYILGILFGALLSKATLLLVIKLSGVNLKFEVFYSLLPFTYTFIFFGICYLCTYFYTLVIVYKTKLINLVHADAIGEKEVKAKIPLCIIGILCLGIGYYLALTVTSVASAFGLFLRAAILVMIGTYCLFSSIFIAILNLLKKSKKYYYQKNHFINISSMIYRMKQNAISLSNICILSCMIIVTLSFTLTVYFGSYRMMEASDLSDINVQIYVDSPDTIEIANQAMLELAPNQTDVKTELRSTSYLWSRVGNSIKKYTASRAQNDTSITFYNLSSGMKYYDELKNKQLEPGHIILISNHETDIQTIEVNAKTYIVDEVIHTSELKMPATSKSQYTMTVYEAFINDLFAEKGDLYSSVLLYDYCFDTTDDITSTVNSIREMFASSNYHGVNLTGTASSSTEDMANTKEVYGNLLFVGFFLGLAFVLATGLMIYYKQITEGYDDLERYHILQQVGLSKDEVKKCINSQIITLFFLPLIVAIIHVSVAFHIEQSMLVGFAIMDPRILLKYDVITIAVFALLYYFIYRMTTNVYYKIVKR